MSKHGHTTTFIVKGADFFAAHLDNGGVRLGMVGGDCFDIPAGHAWYARIAELTNEKDTEDYFDELFGQIGAI